ncbi:IclR family transcriptional regulator [Amycolatopsis acidicola]|uniref:IclR family transcriptional regulator n=1 Tax=Amycolatopsis acidicola TaxID=2596893 RepID=A0A5N0UKL5_9PSEU|nr:IclR family transcriptional regulator [Amycolatopsis acidicola]KAA9149415.1 IclR family transcriptional regulator [Amycolatopsis acidicola]
MIRNTEPGRVEAVHRALVLLKLMAAQGSLSVTEAAKALDVNPSTAQRLLVTLVADDFAVQGERKRYEPGPAYGLGAVQPLRVRVRPFLERLFERVEETCHLAVLVGTEIHHLDGIEAVRTLRFGLRTGVRLPAHVTSAGKAMLAGLPREEVEARYQVAPRDLGKADLERLHQELALTRKRGIGSNFEESEPGVAAFAVALGAIDGEIAALSIAMPRARYGRGDREKFAAHLLRTAAEAREVLVR